MMLRGITVTVNFCTRWLQVVIILPIGRPANNSLSVVIFMKNWDLEKFIETCILK
jgi:hypothetical protein